jgi:hypothetical protein
MKDATIPEISSNFTDEEAIRHVKHYLPNPSQPIAEVLSRLEKMLAPVDGARTAVRSRQLSLRFDL